MRSQHLQSNGEQVFRFHPQGKFRVVTVFLVSVFITVLLTLGWIRTGTRELSVLAIYSGVLAALSLRGLHRVLGTIKLDDESITYSNLAVSVRINFKDVTEVKYRPEWQHLQLRSLNSKILCHRGYRDIELLIEILHQKIPLIAQQESQREPEKDVTEFRYSRKYRIMMVLGFLLFAGMAIVSICLPESEADSRTRWILASCFSAFALLEVYCVYATSQKIVLRDDCLVSQWLGRRRTIRYDNITRIVHGGLHRDEYIKVFSPKARIECSRQLQDYQTLVRRLEKIAPIRWKREELVMMPMTVPTRWWVDPAVGIPFGIALAFGGLYFCLKLLKKNGSAFHFIVFSAGVFMGLGMLADSIYKLLKTPRRYAFYPDRIVIATGLGERVISVDNVKEVALRQWRDPGRGPKSGFDIRLENETISLKRRDTKIPLVPLYELLRRTYTPEDMDETHGQVETGGNLHSPAGQSTNSKA
jgi:hypothetical protein